MEMIQNQQNLENSIRAYKEQVEKTHSVEDEMKPLLKASLTVNEKDQHNFQCPSCLEMLYNPVKDKCDQFFCKECIDQWEKGKLVRSCPWCKNVLELRELSTFERNSFK